MYRHIVSFTVVDLYTWFLAAPAHFQAQVVIVIVTGWPGSRVLVWLGLEPTSVWIIVTSCVDLHARVIHAVVTAYHLSLMRQPLMPAHLAEV